LIPLIAFYLGWIKRDQLAQLPRRPNLAMGGLLLLFSTILLVAGRAGGFVLAEAISLLILLPGIVLSIWGPGHLRALILPLAYLQFMIPWTEEFITQAAWPFQLFSARLGSLLLEAMGFPVFREATYLQLPHVTLEIVTDCSGLGQLYSVIALAIPLVYLTQRTWWRAAGVLGFGVAIMILANGVRMALLAAVSYYYGLSMLDGWLHFFQGWFVAEVGILFLFLVNWAVTKLPCASRSTLHERWKGLTTNVVPTNTLSRTAGLSALLTLSLLGLGYYLHVFASPHPVPSKQSLAELPHVIDGWRARDSAWIQGNRFFPGTAAETVRTYHTISGKEIFLYIGYFASQRQGESLTGRLSNPIRRDARELRLPKAVAGLQRVSYSIPTIDGKRYEALFWYHLSSGNTTGRYETKLRQFLDPVIRGHNNGAVILLATPASENHDGAAAVGDLMEFATVIAPVLEEYLP
jgi:EpsI family protein